MSGTDGVSAAGGVLELQLMYFAGSIGTPPGDTSGNSSSSPESYSQEFPNNAPPMGGGPGGFGGGQFNIDQTTVAGVDPSNPVGPYAGLAASEGRVLNASDTSAALVTSNYATSNELTIGDVVEVTGTDMEIVGIVDASSIADIVLPLSEAQALSDNDGVVSTVYVTAEDSKNVEEVQKALENKLPEHSV